MLILGIESSCDESALSLIDINSKGVKIIKNLVSSQIDIHKKYGGIVPEVAARAHCENFFPLLKELDINIKKDVDIIAATYGPGLITSLVVGFELAKTLSFAYDKPLIPINHIEAHIYSNWLSHEELFKEKIFPCIAVVISGGHTQIFLMKNFGKYKLLGETVDDAVGEAYDKVAKILGLGYPGGPIISKLAGEFSGVPKIEFPSPMINTHDFNFSFSGLKTSVLYSFQKEKNMGEEKIKEYCFAFERAVCKVLSKKIIGAAKKYNVKNILLGGGVSANTSIRKSIEEEAQKLDIKTYYPELKFTGDNAAMIAVAGFFNRVKLENKSKAKKNNFKIKSDPNLGL